MERKGEKEFNQNEFEDFIKRNKNSIPKEIISQLNKVKTRILSANEEGLQSAGNLIKENKLVSFPTETVYGLGANALNAEAVLSIFRTKGRPLTDPIIVHVSGFEECKKMLILSSGEEKLASYLTNEFWPGPLTLVLKANLDVLPEILTAGTGFVGIRCPSHPIALALLKEANLPIAAPSANLFAHISPTTSVHVFNDFWNKEIAIIDGGASQLGFESSVVKVEEGNKILRFLRLGSLSPESMREALSKSQEFSDYKVVVKAVEEITNIEEKAEAPGQLLKHYSPYLDTSFASISTLSSLNELNTKSTVLIDFGGRAKDFSLKFLATRDISQSGDLREAMHNFYDYLRWAENIEGANSVVIVDVDEFRGKEFGEAVYDKIYRAAAGKSIQP